MTARTSSGTGSDTSPLDVTEPKWGKFGSEGMRNGVRVWTACSRENAYYNVYLW